jgi:Cof subfamily protein (haloacid dehalogenase superfamily)
MNASDWKGEINMKLIATDLDGTLLNEEHGISEENRIAIRQAQEKGIEVVIATGRTYFDALSICEQYGLKTYLITYNGAAVHTKDGQQLLALTMDRNDVINMVQWLDENDYYYEVSTDKKIYMPQNGKKRLKREADKLKDTKFFVEPDSFAATLDQIYSQRGMTPINHVKEISANEGVYKVFCFSLCDEKRQVAINQFAGMKQFMMTSSLTNNFEMGHKDASKGNALKIIANQLGISLNQAMAIGDNYNDISMLERVKYSVAMGNAKDEIKKLCSYVTDSNEQNGVAHAIQKFLGRDCKK